MSSLTEKPRSQQDCLYRVERIASEYAVTFGAHLAVADSFVGAWIAGASHDAMASIIVPITNQNDPPWGTIYRALNFAVWQALVMRHLPLNAVDTLKELSEARMQPQEALLVHQLACDAIAIRLAEDRFVHSDRDEQPFVPVFEDRRQIVLDALLTTVELVVSRSLGTTGVDLLQRIRFLTELEELAERFPRASQKRLQRLRSALRAGAQKNDLIVTEARILFAGTLMYFEPAVLLGARASAPPKRLRLVDAQ